jgi:hypothetical protein
MDVSHPADPPRPSDARDSTEAPSTNVHEFVRPFDPMSSEAESQYNAVVRRVNRVRAMRSRNDRERLELERQFVENDLTVRTGPRTGLPLSVRGRRQRIRRLFELAVEAQRLENEEGFSVLALERMNNELDLWASDTYGP